MPPHFSPTIDDLLTDPLVQALMRADRVDAAALKRELARVTARVAGRRRERAPELNGARVRFGAEPRPSLRASPFASAFSGCQARLRG